MSATLTHPIHNVSRTESSAANDVRTSSGQEDVSRQEEKTEPSDLEKHILNPPFRAPAHASPNGLEQILHSGQVSCERLPMLEIIFDRFVRLSSASLRNFTNDNVEITLGDITSMRFGDYLDNVQPASVFAVFKAEEWENYGLMVINSDLAYSIIDVLLGGKRMPLPRNLMTRTHTAIEQALLEQMVQLILHDLSTAFDPVCAVSFLFERLEINTRFATITRASGATFMTRMSIEIDSRGGDIDILLPNATLEPVRDLLAQQFMGEKFGRDSVWETHLATEIQSTSVDLQAVLCEQTISLGTLRALKPGSQLVLDCQKTQPVSLKCGDLTLFKGQSGRIKQNIAVKINETVIKMPEGILLKETSYS